MFASKIVYEAIVSIATPALSWTDFKHCLQVCFDYHTLIQWAIIINQCSDITLKRLVIIILNSNFLYARQRFDILRCCFLLLAHLRVYRLRGKIPEKVLKIFKNHITLLIH